MISRAPKAKAIGIKMQAMGAAVKRYVHSHGLTLFSTNPPLYRDLSRQVMQTLAHFCPQVAVYSVDEAFLALTGFSERDWLD